MSSAVSAPGRLPLRWIIFGFTFAFTFVCYPQRLAVSVAAERMMPELGFSQTQIGWLSTAFLITYTAFQIPGGLLGRVLGPRRMLTLCGAGAVAATLAVPLLPGLAAGIPLFVALLAAQLVLGAMQGPVFAMVAATLERWFPPRQWALTQGLSSSGIGLGSAAAPACIAALMVACGWRAALIIMALPVLVLLTLWWRHGADAPRLHRWATPRDWSGLAHDGVSAPPLTWRRLRNVLAMPDLLLLSLSYVFMNVAFYVITLWSFLYLVQERHFSELGGGLAASLPPLAGALGAAVGGIAATRLHDRYGAARGLRIVPLAALPTAGLFLLFVLAENPFVALAGLTLSFGILEMTEAPFWAAAMEMGGEDAAAGGAVLNTGGNLGGIIATPLVASLSGGGNWVAPFAIGAAGALLSAVLWLFFRPARRAMGGAG